MSLQSRCNLRATRSYCTVIVRRACCCPHFDAPRLLPSPSNFPFPGLQSDRRRHGAGAEGARRDTLSSLRRAEGARRVRCPRRGSEGSAPSAPSPPLPRPRSKGSALATTSHRRRAEGAKGARSSRRPRRRRAARVPPFPLPPRSPFFTSLHLFRSQMLT